MGTFTYSNFQTYLKFELGERTDLDSYLPIWTNQSYLNFCSRKSVGAKDLFLPKLDVIDESKSTVDGQQWVIEPTDALFIHTVWDESNDNKLDYLAPDKYWNKTGRKDTSSEGKPNTWTPYGSKLYLYPTPDDAYELEIPYRKRPALLSATSDTTVIGAEWDEVILKLAVIIALRKLRMYKRADDEEKEWILTVRDMIGMRDRQRRDSKEYMKPSYSYLEGYKYRGRT